MQRVRTRLVSFVTALAVALTACTATPLLRLALFPTPFLEPPPAEPPDIVGLEVLCVPISNGGCVEAWFIPGEGVTAERPGPVVFLFHGNAMFIDDLLPRFEAYRLHGVSLVLPEYRGYGRSDGTPSEAAITQDLVWLYDRIAARPDVDAARSAMHGYSVGGAAACALAARRPPAALVLQSTFTSFAELVGEFGVPALVVDDVFDNPA